MIDRGLKGRVVQWTMLVFVGCAIAAPAQAEKLSNILPRLLATHDLVKAAESDLDAARERQREARGGWYPNLNVTGHYGHEKYDKPQGTNDTEAPNRMLDLSVTQLLYDFGGTDGAIRVAEINRDIARLNLESARQNLVLRAVTAYINLKRAFDVLALARESEENIKRQTDLEDALVQRGAGLSTDLLQAKQQLAGAQARRVQAQGQLLIAENAYRAAFRADPPDPPAMVAPELPVAELPATLEESIAIALDENPALAVANSTAHVRRETVRVTKGGLSPRLEAVAGAKHQIDEGGTMGAQEVYVGKVQLTWPFNLGMTAVNTLSAAKSDAAATSLRAAEQRHLIEQQVRNAWDNLRTARENAEFLRNQANIAGEFLELARRERQAGNRSLLDLLAGETALINANSDARAAEADVGLWAFTLLNAMGRLTLDKIVD